MIVISIRFLIALCLDRKITLQKLVATFGSVFVGLCLLIVFYSMVVFLNPDAVSAAVEQTQMNRNTLVKTSSSEAILPDLIITDTYYIDSIRTNLAVSAYTGTQVISITHSEGFTLGQEILIISMQGSHAGVYETHWIEHINGQSVTLSDTLSSAFNILSNTVMVQHIPHYRDVIVEPDGVLTAHGWDGQTGGVIFFRSEEFIVKSGGLVDISGLGYRGGMPSSASDWNSDAYQGESITGMGIKGNYPDEENVIGVSNNGGGGVYLNGGGGNYAGGATDSKYYNGTLRDIKDAQGLAGVTYGTPELQRLYLGSAGGGGYDYGGQGELYGGNGAGILYVQSSDYVRVDGEILANGLKGVYSGYASGAGSGGSIYLISHRIYVEGVVQALGGEGDCFEHECEGSGGRGRIRLDALIITGTTTPAPYISTPNATEIVAHSTISVNKSIEVGDNVKTLTVTITARDTNGALSGLPISLTTSNPNINIHWTYDRLTDADGQVDVNLTALVTDYLPLTASIQTTILSAAPITLSNSPVVTFTPSTITVSRDTVWNFPYVVASTLIVTNEAHLEWNHPSSKLKVDTLIIKDSAMMVLTSTTIIDAKHVIVGIGASMVSRYDVASTNVVTQPLQSGAGGSHGGVGGATSCCGPQPVYGDLYLPVQPGSTGDMGYENIAYGGYGGGAIYIRFEETLNVQGEISVNGADGRRDIDTSGGGGAGGSIFIQSEAGNFNLATSGKLSADGGDSPNGGGGGGGRIAIYAQKIISGQLSVNGGNGLQNGEIGSIYLGEVDPYTTAVQLNPKYAYTGFAGANLLVAAKTKNGQPLADQPVEMYLITGNELSAGTIPVTSGLTLIGATDETGFLTTTLTTMEAGIYEVGLFVGSVPLKMPEPLTVSFSAADIELTLSDIQIDPTTISADGDSVGQVVVTLIGGDGNPVQNKDVVFITNGTNVNIAPQIATTGFQGEALTYVSSSDIQYIVITPTVDGVALAQTATVTFTAAAPTLPQSTIMISPTTAFANGSDTIVILATLRDEQERPLANRVFTLSDGTTTSTDQNGHIYFTLASTERGTQTITLEDSLTQTVLDMGIVEFIAAEPNPNNSFITANPLALPSDGQATTIITVTIQDSHNHPIEDTAVTMGFSAPSPITFTQTATQTNLSGQITATIQSAFIQSVVITASIENGLLNDSEIVNFQPTTLNPSHSSFYITPTTVIANGTQPITITAQLTDTLGRLFTNMPLTLSVSGQNNIIFPQATQTTTAAGTITFTVTSTTAETKTITVTDSTYNLSFPIGTVDFLPSDVDAIRSSIERISSYSAAYANGQETLEFLVTARDVNGNPVPNVAVNFDITSDVFPNPIVTSQNALTTNENGQALLTTRSSEPTDIRVWAVIDGVAISQYAEAQFSLADPDQSLLTIIGLDMATADGQELIQLSTIAKTADGTPLQGASVTFSTTAEYANQLSFIQPNQLTAANGRTIGFVTSLFEGTYPIYASIDGVQLPAPINVAFKGPDLTLALDAPSEIMAGFPITYNLVVHNDSGFDAYNIAMTQTLPAGTAFVSSSPQLTYDPETHQLVGTLSYLTAGASTNLITVLQIPTTTVTTLDFTAVASMDQDEANLANNQAIWTTQSTPPAAILNIVTPFPVTTIQQGETSTIDILIRNTGSLPLENISTTLAVEAPWLTLPDKIGTLLPFAPVTLISITVMPDIEIAPATYLNTLTFTADNAPSATARINTRVQAPTRNLIVTARDQNGDTVSGAFVSVEESQTVVSESDTFNRTITHNAFTDENGRATFPTLESDKPYTITISAIGYENLPPANVQLSRDTTPYTHNFILQGIADLLVQPAFINLATRPNEVASEQITLRNIGVTTISNLKITPPQNQIDFAYIGQTSDLPPLDPGDAFTFTLNVAPSLSHTKSIYQDILSIEGSNEVAQTVPVVVRILEEELVTLCVIAIADYNQTPLANVTVVATEQSGLSPDDFQLKQTVQTDTSGQGCFPEMPTGPYQVDLIWNGSQVASEMIDLVYDETRPVQIQYEEIIAITPSVDVTWSVTPIKLTDRYTTTVVLDFRPESPPLLAASPQHVKICTQDNGFITETVTIHNFFPVHFTNVRIGLGIMNEDDSIRATLIDPETGASVNEGGLLSINSIAPNADKELTLTAELIDRETCSGNSGTVFLRVFADYKHYLPDNWYDVDDTVNRIPLDEKGQIPLKLAHRDYPEESNLNISPAPLEDVTISQPTTFNWMTVTPTYFERLEVGEDEIFTLDVEPPDWLPEGTYHDYLLVTATNGIDTIIGIVAERTPFGLEIETRFVTPLTVHDGVQPNDPDPFPQIAQRERITTVIEGTTSFINDTFPLTVGCNGCGFPSSVTRGGSSLTYSYVGQIEDYAPTFVSSDFENRVVIFQLSQQFAIEREAFLAQLDLRNGLPVSLTDMSVEIQISDRPDELGEKITIRTYNEPITATQPFTLNIPTDDFDGSGGSSSGGSGGSSGGSSSGTSYPGVASNIPDSWQQSSFVNFIMIPDTPTGIPDIQAGGNYLATWTLAPDAIGLTDLNGVDFYVQATINYTPDGQLPAPPITTNPAKIRVHPQPLIVLDYFLPTYVLGGQSFAWTVIVTNVGSGIGRNIHIHTPQPIILNTKGAPVSFTLQGETNVMYEELYPGESKELVFLITPSEDGAFAGASASCEQQNYQGVQLPPLIYCHPTIHWVNTNHLYYAQQQTLAKEGCMTTLHQAFKGDPVNTYSGNFTLPAMDVSIPTWGLPLQFERTYNALTQDEPGPLGQGWTHNYNASIEYKPYIYRDETGQTVTENRLSARLPHGSRAYFEVDINGNISPMSGVRAQLTEELGVYTLTQECDQTTYIFENRVFTNPYSRLDAVLTEIIDGDGNKTIFDYDPDEGYLTKVTDPSGRTPPITYRYENDQLLS